MNRKWVLALCVVISLALTADRSAGLATEYNPSSISDRAFNPAVSVILDGRYAYFEQDPGHYRLAGFQLGGEAGLGPSGLSLGHSELAMSANIDDKFYGNMTAALHSHEGETHVELEEAYLVTLGLGHGLAVKAGRFLSSVGYLNESHDHDWDFADPPLVYRGLFGNHLRDDGLQLNCIAPTAVFAQAGAELLHGEAFPAGGAANDGVGAYSLFANVGGDVGVDHSWQMGVSHWSADVEDRAATGHSHAGHSDNQEEPATACFSGESRVYGLDAVWKWAPDGNPSIRNFKLQFEYLNRKEEGTVTILGSEPPQAASYDGTQDGWYAQAVFQFMPQWRVGLRYDQVRADNTGSDNDVFEEAGLDDESARPERISVMLDWSNSEFSRIRLQYNYDNSRDEKDHQMFLQYTMSLGSHGAHQF